MSQNCIKHDGNHFYFIKLKKTTSLSVNKRNYRVT